MPVPGKPVALVQPLQAKAPSLLQHEGITDELTLGIILASFEDFPKGSTLAQVIHCVKLIEHIPKCTKRLGTCEEGEACHRTRQVLAHHLTCRKSEGDCCSICRQVLALYRIHSERCQANKGDCDLYFCKKYIVGQLKKNQLLENQTREGCHHVIRNFSKLSAHKTKEQKLQKIKRLLLINPHAATQVLQSILKKRQLQNSLCQGMKNRNTSKGIESTNRLTRGLLTPGMTSVSSSFLRLDVIVRARIIQTKSVK